jgi:GntR family transcriptional regulator
MARIGRARDRRSLPVITRELLEKNIRNGRFAAGSQLPSEEQLSNLLGVSRPTLREAIRAMEDDGLVQRRRGIGTFVLRAATMENRLDINAGVTQLIEQAGMHPGTIVVRSEERPANAEEADGLHLASNASVLLVERIRTADDTPVVFSRDVLAAGVIALEHMLEGGSIYDEFLRHGRVVHHGLVEIAAVAASPDIAKHLNVKLEAPILLLRQTDFDVDDNPILLSHEWHVPDAFRMTIYRRGSSSATK